MCWFTSASIEERRCRSGNEWLRLAPALADVSLKGVVRLPGYRMTADCHVEVSLVTIGPSRHGHSHVPVATVLAASNTHATTSITSGGHTGPFAKCCGRMKRAHQMKFISRRRALRSAWTMVLIMSVVGPASCASPDVHFRSDGGRTNGALDLPTDLDPAVSQVWHCPLPSGHSTPCLYGDRLFVTTYDAEAEQLATVAIDKNSGQILWRQVAPRREIETYHRVGSPAAATPACDGQRVYVFFGSYGLLTYDLDGNPGWARSLGPFQDEFGSSSSPVLFDDLLILNEDHDRGSTLFAFDKRTGETVWKAARDEFTRSYSTPIIVTVDGHPQIIVAGALTVTGYDPRDGSRLWWMHGLARIVNTTPALHENALFLATWSPGGDSGERIEMEDWDLAVQQYDVNHDAKIRRDELSEGPVLTRFFRIDLDQDGGIDQQEWQKHADVFQRAKNSVRAVRLGRSGELATNDIAWEFSKGIPYVASPVYDDGVLYMVKDGGILTSLDARSGTVIKQGRLRGRGNYYASPQVADEKIYLASERGTVTVVSADGDWRILGSHDFAESIYATPVAQGDRLYLRTSEALYCLSKDRR